MVKRKKAKKVGQIEAVGTRLKGFVDWVDPISNEPAEEREDDMFNFVGFAAWMRPQDKGSRQAGVGFTTSTRVLQTLGAPR